MLSRHPNIESQRTSGLPSPCASARRMPWFALALVTIATVLPSCLPQVKTRIRTRILEDGTAIRETVIEKIRRDGDNEEQKRLNARPLLEDLGKGLLADFPGAQVTDDRIRITGVFSDPETMPPDFRRDVELLDQRAQNHVSFRMEDILIGTRYLYREHFVDAISPDDQRSARKALVRFAVRFLQAAVRHEFGRAYDTSAFSRHASEELATLFDDLIGVYWSERQNISKTDPVTGKSGLDRALARVKDRLARAGLPVSEELESDDNLIILRTWLCDLLANTLIPITAGSPAPRPADFAYLFPEEEPLVGLQIAAERAAELEYGSVDQAERAFRRALLGVTGTFGSPPAEAEFHFDCAVEMPGVLLRTNGFVESEKSAFWLFDGENIFPDGISLELESVVLRPELLGGIREVRHDLTRRDAVMVIGVLSGTEQAIRQRMKELLSECAQHGTVDWLANVAGDDATETTKVSARKLAALLDVLAN